MSYDQEGAIRLLTRILTGSAPLAGAACIGQTDLFAPAGQTEPPHVIRRRHEAAARICRHTCPALAECTAWAAQLTPTQRPAGVVAGRRPNLPAAPGRPAKGSPAA
ncbi:WhiB family transcriptional regulator [Tsukamurella paurometabola]|uniref:4Fe-4S Wbl-type domain-containing protein n=1 Tax=Tsukamurella paurometabola TaxID=2061 RepID=A0A3P8MEF1_TSUPA|nr:WhiB family transcriptional regulator [Tsukamurella paurometabola]UEA83009.1 WhiB family transcriptional regulator [Tsukamurella paurometabola]VDR40093.1 Uncharacterised protein [Tsukamurella paurometabola]